MLVLKLTMKSDFFEKVYEIVCQIPHGRVTTYGMIAKTIGSPQSARMVGWAMNASHKKYTDLPAHRVVNRNGFLSGKMHFDYPDKMQKLLESEGVIIVDDKIQNFDSLVWDPMLEF